MTDVPYRFERTHYAAEVVEHGRRSRPGEESGVDRRGGRPAHAARARRASPPSPSCATRRGRSSSSRWPSMTEGFDEFAKLNLGDWIGARGEVVRTRRGELSVKVSEWVLLAEARRSFGDKWRGVSRRRDALPPARGRPVGQRAQPRASSCCAAMSCADPRALEARASSRSRRRCCTRPGRGHGPAVRHPPQRARHGLLPAHRPRAVPEAAGGRRDRAGVRDRPGLPQRGHLAPPQPRVHDARALPGLRRLHRHHGPHRGAGRRPGQRAARHHQARPTAAATSTSPRRGGGPPWSS